MNVFVMNFIFYLSAKTKMLLVSETIIYQNIKLIILMVWKWKDCYLFLMSKYTNDCHCLWENYLVCFNNCIMRAVFHYHSVMLISSIYLYKLWHWEEKEILQLHFKLYVTLCVMHRAFCKTPVKRVLHFKSHRDFSLALVSFTIKTNCYINERISPCALWCLRTWLFHYTVNLIIWYDNINHLSCSALPGLCTHFMEFTNSHASELLT